MIPIFVQEAEAAVVLVTDVVEAALETETEEDEADLDLVIEREDPADPLVETGIAISILI